MGGAGDEKSDDFALFETFLDTHPNNPGIYLAGDDVAEEWASLLGAAAVSVRSTYMDFIFARGNHVTFGEPISPLVRAGVPGSYGVFDGGLHTFDFFAYGGCPAINDFDVMFAGANSRVEITYPNGFPTSGAVLAQATPNSAGTTARFVLGGFGYDFIRDDIVGGQLERCRFLAHVLTWFGNLLPMAIGINPVVYENALENAYPNPFNPTTTIGYSIAERSHVSLKIYNVAGQLIKTLVDEIQSPRAEESAE